MLELQLKLSYGALESIARGSDVSIVIDEEDITIIVGADDDAVQKFKDMTQKALLAMLPTPPGAH